MQYYLFLNDIFTGFLCYIFASLCFISKREHLWKKEKCFLLYFNSCFRFWDNQILTFQVFKCYGVMKCLIMKSKYILLNNFESKHSLVKNFGQYMSYHKNLVKKILQKRWAGNYFLALFNFRKILSRNESREVSVLI